MSREETSFRRREQLEAATCDAEYASVKSELEARGRAQASMKAELGARNRAQMPRPSDDSAHMVAKLEMRLAESESQNNQLREESAIQLQEAEDHVAELRRHLERERERDLDGS